MATFDPEEIMEMQTEGEMATSFTPVPEGEYPAYITKVDARSGTSKAGNDYTMMDVQWAITDPGVAEEVGIEEPSVRQSLFLDFDESTGALAMGKGKNIALGRLRAAVGQNGPGAWNPRQLEGAAAVVRVSHRENDGNIYAEVRGVSAA